MKQPPMHMLDLYNWLPLLLTVKNNNNNNNNIVMLKQSLIKQNIYKQVPFVKGDRM